MSVSAKVKEKSSINFCNLYMVALLLLIPLWEKKSLFLRRDGVGKENAFISEKGERKGHSF